MEKKDDNALVGLVLGGEVTAYRTIVERHQARIFYLGLKFFHNAEDAEDFAQEVFLRAFTRLENFSGNVPFASWLYRVAFNLAVNQYHLSRRHLLEADLNPQITDKNPSPETKLLQKEFKDRVRETLKHLPDAYNIVIKMHYFEGFSYPEISRASGIPVNTIKSHIFRAKKIIKSRLEAYVEE